MTKKKSQTEATLYKIFNSISSSQFFLNNFLLNNFQKHVEQMHPYLKKTSLNLLISQHLLLFLISILSPPPFELIPFFFFPLQARKKLQSFQDCFGDWWWSRKMLSYRLESVLIGDVTEIDFDSFGRRVAGTTLDYLRLFWCADVFKEAVLFLRYAVTSFKAVNKKESIDLACM